MKILTPLLAAAALLAPGAASQQTPTPESLTKLEQLVQKLVDEDQVVGAELLLIQRGEPILHESFGWRNREKEQPMVNGSLFCVRSMTKPLTGTAILMLAQEGKLQLDDPVHKYLPYFDVDVSRQTTIRHLLHHSSGLPMSLIMAMNLDELNDIHDVAKLGAGAKLEFPPGQGFRYSDQGTDTLAAVVEAVSDLSFAAFVEQRILQPLGMEQSLTELTDDHELRDIGCSKYAGTPGNWTAYWNTEQPTIFPFFLGSQGLYCTAEDYAKFTALWLNNGRVGERQLLDQKWIDFALTPGPHPMNGRSGLPNMRSLYGALMMVWTATESTSGDATGKSGDASKPRLTAFGHNGSDGTHAWVFPEHDAMAFYFTQSRGTQTGFQVEEALGEVFFGVEVAAAQEAPPAEPYLGYFREHEDDSYRAVVQDGDGMALEVPGKGVVALEYVGEDRWKSTSEGFVITFERDEEGEVVSFTLANRREFKFQPAADLPTGAEVAAMVAKAHGLHKLEAVGPMRMNSDIEFTRTGMKGTITTTYSWPNQVRISAQIGNEFEYASFDGQQSWYHSRAKPRAKRDGVIGDQIRLDHHFARFGNLLEWHPQLHVVQKLHRANKDLLLVRTNTTSAAARTLFVDANTGQMLGEDNVVLLEGLGLMGQRLRFNDFREIEGMLLPYELQLRFSNKMIGTLKSKVTNVEFGVELADDFFQLPLD